MKKLERRLNQKVVLGTLLGLVLVLTGIASFLLIYTNRFFPGVSVAGVDLFSLTEQEASQKITSEIARRQVQELEFSYQSNQKFQIKLGEVVEALNLAPSLAKAFALGHTEVYFQSTNILLSPTLSKSVDVQLATISQSVDTKPIEAQLKVAGDEITVSPSQEGLEVNREEVKNRIIQYLNTGKLNDNILPTRKSYPNLSYNTALSIKSRLDQIKLEPLKLTFKGQTFIWDLSTILELIDLETSENSLASAQIASDRVNLNAIKIGDQTVTDSNISINESALQKHLNRVATQIDRPVKEPLFNFNPASPNRVTEFQPPQEGQKLDLVEAEFRIKQALLTSDQKLVALPVSVVKPQNKLSNEMGIKELIGRGTSNFAGSIPNRIFNVSHGSSKINGIIIGPNETFSFNNTVGDITAATGFKQAYVIKSGRTVLDDGGGICQVSTTLYRAVLNSGLPVVARTPHAYRVGYYEQGFPPGLDATVYYPSVDFQFKNDTGHHILIQTTVSGLNLTVDLYGTDDGRITSLSTPKILSQTPPLPEVRQDDPTLPKGTIKQVDWSAWGAKVVFTRTVLKNGQKLINETVNSSYRPWQAVYLVGTGG